MVAQTGTYLVKCSTAVNDSNPNNNSQTKILFVRPPSGIVENWTQFIVLKERIIKRIPTIMNIIQFANFLSEIEKSQLPIVDITGRSIKPEEIKTGIYFIKTEKLHRLVIVK